VRNEERLREIAKVLSGSSSDFRDSIVELAFNFHCNEDLEPAAHRRYVERVCQYLFSRLRVENAKAGIDLSDERVAEIIGALMTGALDVAVTFPMTGGHA
jgi:hypothetical protein